MESKNFCFECLSDSDSTHQLIHSGSESPLELFGALIFIGCMLFAIIYFKNLLNKGSDYRNDKWY